MRISSAVGIALVVASSALAGCAGMAQSPNYRSTLEPSRYEVDAKRMATVNTQARANGIRVVWVNPPIKRLKSADNSD